MRRRIIILLLLIYNFTIMLALNEGRKDFQGYILANKSQADKEKTSVPKISAFAGLSMASFAGTPPEGGWDHKLSFINLGISYRFDNAIPRIIVEPGVSLSSKGAKNTDKQVLEKYYELDEEEHYYVSIKKIDSDYELLYLDIFTKVKIGTLPISLYPYLGLSVSTLLNAKGKIEGSFTEFEDDELIQSDSYIDTIYDKDIFNTLDFGILFGLDYVFAKRYSVGFEYNVGIVDIAKDDTTKIYPQKIKMKNNTMFFTIGYLF